MSDSMFSCATNMDYITKTIKWTIRNLKLDIANGLKISSAKFPLDIPDIFITENVTVHIEMFCNDNKIVFRQVCLPDEIMFHHSITAVSTIFLIASDTVLLQEKANFGLYKFPDSIRNEGTIPSMDIVILEGESLTNFLRQIKGEFTVQLSLTLVSSVRPSEAHLFPINPPVEVTELTGLYDLYEDAESSDVTFVVQKTIFKAHKPVLSSRSPQLKALVDDASNPDKIEIHNIEPAAFKVFLESLYDHKQLKIETIGMAMELFCAAHKYKVDYIRYASGNYMTSNISVDNAYAILKIAEEYNEENMRNYVISFMTDNVRKFPEITLHQFVAEYPHLLKGILYIRS